MASYFLNESLKIISDKAKNKKISRLGFTDPTYFLSETSYLF